MTWADLAMKAGVSRQAVYRISKGHDVQVSTMLSVMDVLGLDLVALPRGMDRLVPDLKAGWRPMATRPLRPEGLHVSDSSEIVSAVKRRMMSVKQTATNKKGSK